MKRIILAGAFAILIFNVFAQDIKSAKTAFQKNDLATAKTQIDGYVEKNPKNFQKPRMINRYCG